MSQIIPATAQALGVNPLDPASAIDGQARLMAENLQRYGSPEQAVLAYHGGTDQANWGPKTRDYLQKVTAAYGGGKQTMAKPQGTGDPFLDMADGVAAPAGSSKQQASTGDPLLDMADAVKPSAADTSGAQATAQMTPQQIETAAAPSQTPLADGLGRVAQGAMAIPNGIYQGFRTVTDTGLQGATRAIDKVAGTNLAAEADANAAKARSDFNAQYSGNSLVDKVARTSDVGGQIAATSPVLGLKILQGAGMGAKAVNGAIQGGAFGALTSSADATDPLAKQVAQGAGFGAAGNVLLGKLAQTQYGRDLIDSLGTLAGKAADASGANALAVKLGLKAENAPVLPKVNATAEEVATARDVGSQEAMARKAAESAAKPKFKLNTDGSMTPVEAPAAPTAPVAPFTPPQAPATGPAGSTQAAQNKQTIQAIGLDSARESALTGDKRMAGVEYQQSKLQTPQGEVLNAQLQKEQAALKNYGQKLVADTGATATAPEQVGQSIRSPLAALSDHYDTQIGNLYKQADQRAAGAAAVNPEEFGTLLGTNSNFAGKAENSQLRRGIRAYAREQGIIGDDGALQPMDVKTAEGMRQYLNSQWSPQNSGLIGKIKQALDSDVGRAGGQDIYQQARALHAERANTLDNPNGIASLLNESGPGGINQAVPDEKVGAKVLTMPTGQFKHVVDTLKALPPELQGQGQQALNEIKGTLAKQIYSAGDSGGTQAGPSAWNAAKVTKELNAQRSKLAQVFSPEELQGFQTLHDAGHILQAPSAYPGAAVQGHNLAQRGLLYGASPTGGAFIGGHLAGPAGAMAGASIGAAVNNKLAQALEQKAANRLSESMKLR